MNTEKEASKAFQLFHQKKFSEAASSFEEIAFQLNAENKEFSATEMMNNASVAYLLSGNPQKAYELSQNTHLTFQEIGDWKNYALALGNQASALENLGKKELALSYYQKAADKLHEIGEKESRAYIMKRISALQIQSGDQFGALGSMTVALNNLPKLSPREKFLKKLTDLVIKFGIRQ